MKNSGTTQRTIPTDRIVRDTGQPRKLFDQAGLEELAESMRTLGQLQPIAVRYDPPTRLYTLVMGERRWRAAQLIDMPTMMAVVLHDLDDESAFVRSVAENVGRKDMTPLEEAAAFRQLVSAGYSHEDIAKMLGRSSEGVRYRIDLLDLTPAAAEAVVQGHLAPGLAWYVSRLSADQQAMFLGKFGRGEFATTRDAEAFVQACRNAANKPATLFGIEEPSTEMREELIATRRRVTSKVEQLARAGEILHELAAMDPAIIAKALAGAPGGVDAYRTRVGHLHAAASKVAALLRKAAAISATTVTITFDSDPELVSA